MSPDKELKINARGLSAPGPRMMVETALEKAPARLLRVIVSDEEAADDLAAYFAGRKARVTIDQMGDEFHVLAELEG